MKTFEPHHCLSLPSFETLGKYVTSLLSLFPHLLNGDKDMTYLTGLSRG